MFFTGFTRFSSDVQKTNNISGSEDKREKLKKMYALVDEAEAVLETQKRNRQCDQYKRNRYVI